MRRRERALTRLSTVHVQVDFSLIYTKSGITSQEKQSGSYRMSVSIVSVYAKAGQLLTNQQYEQSPPVRRPDFKKKLVVVGDGGVYLMLADMNMLINVRMRQNMPIDGVRGKSLPRGEPDSYLVRHGPLIIGLLLLIPARHTP